jgi:lysozyme family protein
MALIYSQKFIKAAQTVLQHEGGYVNRPDDAGGPTRYGISLRFLREENIDINGDGVIDKRDILDLTQEKAIELYYRYMWSKNNYEQIDNVQLARKVFDQSLPLGPHEANMILQRAVNNVVGQLAGIWSNVDKSIAEACPAVPPDNAALRYDMLPVDGVLGEKSIELINKYGCESGVMLEEFCSEAEKVYREIVEKNPTDQVSLAGWLKRLRD